MGGALMSSLVSNGSFKKGSYTEHGDWSVDSSGMEPRGLHMAAAPYVTHRLRR